MPASYVGGLQIESQTIKFDTMLSSCVATGAMPEIGIRCIGITEQEKDLIWFTWQTHILTSCNDLPSVYNVVVLY